MVLPKSQIRYSSNFCCEQPQVVEENGFEVCTSCGSVFNKIFSNTTPRTYCAEDVKKRVSNQRVIAHTGPRSVIIGNHDAKGKEISPHLKALYKRLDKVNRCFTGSFERNLWIAIPSLKTVQEKLFLSDSIASSILRLYIKCVKKKLSQGRKNETLLVACAYCILREYKLPSPMNKLIDLFQIPKKKFLKTYKLVLNSFQKKLDHFTPESYISTFSNELFLPIKSQLLAQEIYKAVKSSGFNDIGKDPRGISSAALFIAAFKSGKKITQKRIAGVARIATITLRARILEFNKYLKIPNLLPKKNMSKKLAVAS